MESSTSFNQRTVNIAEAKRFDAANKLVDENGLPKHFVDGIANMRVCDFVNAKKDEFFGVLQVKKFQGSNGH